MQLLLQAQELMTALHSVCQCLQSSASGKTAENKLQKALNRVHKLEQASIKTGHAAATLSKAAAACETQPATNVATDPSSQQALEPSSATDAALTPGESLQKADVEMDDVGTSQAAKITQPAADSEAHPAASASGLNSEGLPIEQTDQADKEDVRADKEKCKAGKDAARASKEHEKAEKEALKEQQTAEKEQLRQQKEQQKADKERQKAEKEQQKAEREQQKAEKDAEKERIRSANAS